MALVLGQDPDALSRQLSFQDVQVAAVKTEISALQDDALSICVAEALRQLAPSSVLIPGKSHLPRALLPVAAEWMWADGGLL